MKRALILAVAAVLCIGTASAAEKLGVRCAGETCGKEVARFGVITDLHHTNRPDSASRKYSAALGKMAHFVDAMNELRADFIVEMGDFVDVLAGGKDPVQNLLEIENVFTSFNGPTYHTLGNHEFDNVTRADLLTYLNNTGIPAGQTYFSFDRNGIHCIVLDADYTNAEPHRPFDLQDPANPFWNWTDAFIPQAELDWLEADLAAANRPTVVFMHQLLHRDNTEDHTVKNADVVRGILEKDGQVLAVFSGHDHRGEIAYRNGIHYMVLEGNVGISLDWPNVSPTNGLHPVKDSQYVYVEVRDLGGAVFNGRKTYKLTIVGNGQQYSFQDDIQVNAR
jgi:alkaline phosphatase